MLDATYYSELLYKYKMILITKNVIERAIKNVIIFILDQKFTNVKKRRVFNGKKVVPLVQDGKKGTD